MAKVKTRRWGRMLTGSGIFLRNVCAWPANWKDRSVRQQGLGAEVVRMYRQQLKLPKAARVFRDTTASAAPVGLLSCGVYHTLVVAPATSNTVAKCVLAISDTLVTTVFAQAGKCRVQPTYSLATPRLNSTPKRPK